MQKNQFHILWFDKQVQVFMRTRFDFYGRYSFAFQHDGQSTKKNKKTKNVSIELLVNYDTHTGFMMLFDVSLELNKLLVEETENEKNTK